MYQMLWIAVREITNKKVKENEYALPRETILSNHLCDERKLNGS